MIRYRQTMFGDHGDCYRTAIACILEVEPVQVPHLSEMALASDNPGGAANAALNEWLRPRGYQILDFPFLCEADAAATDMVAELARHSPGSSAWYVVVGNTRRSEESGQSHAVVCSADGAVVHDPHPSDAGLEKPISLGDGRYAYWITALVAG